jgi:hypothetical protein
LQKAMEAIFILSMGCSRNLFLSHSFIHSLCAQID